MKVLRGIKIILIFILIFLTFAVFREPGPVWFFPVFLVFYLFRNILRSIFNRIIKKPKLKYILIGVLIGLAIEVLAIISATKLGKCEEALFHCKPIIDLTLATGYYFFLMLGSYFVLKRYEFSVKQFFIIGGIFGIIFEEYGLVLLSLNPLKWIYLFLSYGSFFALPYMLFKDDFNKFKRKKSLFIKYLLAILIFAVFHLFFLVYIIIIDNIFSLGI